MRLLLSLGGYITLRRPGRCCLSPLPSSTMMNMLLEAGRSLWLTLYALYISYDPSPSLPPFLSIRKKRDGERCVTDDSRNVAAAGGKLAFYTGLMAVGNDDHHIFFCCCCSCCCMLPSFPFFFILTIKLLGSKRQKKERRKE